MLTGDQNPERIEMDSQRGKSLSWVASVLVALFCIFVGGVLLRSTGIFMNLFAGLGVELPPATRFLIGTHSWVFPLFLAGAALLVLVKEILLSDVRRRLATTLIIFVAAGFSAGLAQYILNLPLLQIVQKLGETK